MLKKIGCIAGQVKTLLLEKDYIHVYQLITSSEIIYYYYYYYYFVEKGGVQEKRKSFFSLVQLVEPIYVQWRKQLTLRGPKLVIYECHSIIQA